MKTLSKKLITAGALGAAAAAQLFSPIAAWAATVDILPGSLQTSATVTLPNVIKWIITIIVAAGFILAFVFLVIGGIRWILAGGDKTKVEGARGQVIGALVGLVIIILAFVVIMFVQQFFGVNVFTGTGQVNIPTAP